MSIDPQALPENNQASLDRSGRDELFDTPGNEPQRRAQGAIELSGEDKVENQMDIPITRKEVIRSIGGGTGANFGTETTLGKIFNLNYPNQGSFQKGSAVKNIQNIHTIVGGQNFRMFSQPVFTRVDYASSPIPPKRLAKVNLKFAIGMTVVTILTFWSLQSGVLSPWLALPAIAIGIASTLFSLLLWWEFRDE